MHKDTQISAAQQTLAECERLGKAKPLYFALLEDPHAEATRERAAEYLHEQLAAAAELESDLPDKVQDLMAWIDRSTERVGQRYQEYLDARKAGAPRQYFSNKSHALNFLKSVAPTKLVDGAWLYGLLQRWSDARFTALIKTYLEELGDGVPEKNHVVLYRKLLATHGLDDWESLSDDHFVQGAIQLALAYNADQFLPELIGYNLGYEQLPLHLLITSYELTEFGIDPYYFTLHVTVDNAATGHARKAVQGVLDALPQVEDADEFFRRIHNGYRLNDLGESTNSVIAAFDLEQEVITVMENKSSVGKFVHSDYCRFSGRTVNEWLADPAQIPDFLHNLEQRGWIKRHQDPQNSRFWKLIDGERAEMFGVFSAYEQQVIYDWIAGNPEQRQASRALQSISGDPVIPQAQVNYRARRRLFDIGSRLTSAKKQADPRQSFQRHLLQRQHSEATNDFNSELRALEETLGSLQSKDEMMSRLIGLMSPENHHSPSGLMATRIFSQMFS